MNNIYLPELESIEVNNFTLYPNGLNFKYDFINGVNLIVGGNGMGKTTFVNLIKYAIIGHYKEEFDFTRTYLGRKIEKRTSLPWNYFSKRMDDSIPISGLASVKISFFINGIRFEAERSLDEIKLLYISVNNQNLNGISINQFDYDRLFYDYSREKIENRKEELYRKLTGTLPFIFEKEIEACSNMRFDDLIFFVNKILFFGEDHQTILWNDNSDNDVQNELFNNYFNDSKLNSERQEANRQAKYFDTQARHRSEDIRVIKKVLDKVKNEDTIPTALNKIRRTLENLKNERENIAEKLETNQKARKEFERELSISNNKINELSLKVSQLEIRKKREENSVLLKKWVTLHKNYESYSKSIIVNSICPLCSQELEEKFVKRRIQNSGVCILCDQTINQEIGNDSSSTDFQKELDSLHSEIFNHQKMIYNCEDKLKSFDKEFNLLNQKFRKVSSDLRTLEYSLMEEHKKENEPIDQLQAFYDEIANLEIRKDEFQEKSRLFLDRSNEISKKIEDQITKNVLNFSTLFASYAEKFLGVKCSLTYDEINGNKRFYPVINGKIREREEELSESQRFFVDHAFRMSILSFFYTRPSFYIVETPDSSLDISYEHNAADVFMRFLEKPYCLIITTNLNNSEFLNYLAKGANKASIINLLEIGKKSPIQDTNNYLKSILNKVQININERKNS